MKFGELQTWIASPDGLLPEVIRLRRWAAANGLVASTFTPADDIADWSPDWRRLLLGGSILATSSVFAHIEYALLIAQAAILHSQDSLFRDAGGVLLGRLANHRARALAIERGKLPEDLEARLGVSEALKETRRELDQTIFLRPTRQPKLAPSDRAEPSRTIIANLFQRSLWDDLRENDWISATAPTSAGKTFIVMQWLVERIVEESVRLAIFVTPTRALVGEVERTLQKSAAELHLSELRVGSLPVAALGDGSRPTILVFTQERLQVFLNARNGAEGIDAVIIDEAQKIGDGTRGVILQDSIEKLSRANPQAKFIFLSPLSDNPELLLADKPAEARGEAVPSQTPTVIQNVMLAEESAKSASLWELELREAGQAYDLGQLQLHDKPNGVQKKLSFIALALGRQSTGTLVYANDADEAEKVASQIFDGLHPGTKSALPFDSELKDLADFASATVHEKFALAEFVTRGVAFHYGNMPSLLRSEIERLFASGKIRFLVCTSTLIEGVNLACQTIVVRGPRRGRLKKMEPQDFWNLAGRAGRWGQDFQGNIVCIDPRDSKAWPDGVPPRARYAIKRSTDNAAQDPDALAHFIRERASRADDIDENMEQAAAYLLGWVKRTGSLDDCSVIMRLAAPSRQGLMTAVEEVADKIDVPVAIVLRHSGVSAFALQGMLDYLRTRTKDPEDLLPPETEQRTAHQQLIAIFQRIQKRMFPAFIPPSRISVLALTTLNWMRGYPLARMIKERIAWYERSKIKTPSLPVLIRQTMSDVEEVARFKAPKYLSAYVDILNFHLEEIGRLDLMDRSNNLDLFLEFGVGSKTMISMIGLGLSRSSAVELDEWLGSSTLDEAAVFERLQSRGWEGLSIPALVKREIGEVLERQDFMRNAGQLRQV